MPKRLEERYVRQMFIDAGYQLANNFKYVNNKKKHLVLDLFTDQFTRISLQQLRYKLKTHQRPEFSELPFPYPEPENDNIHKQLSAKKRFLNNHSFLNEESETFTIDVWNIYKDLMPKINKKQTFTYKFKNGDAEKMSAQMLAITIALKDSFIKIQKTHNIVLDLETTNERHRYFHVNAATINDLFEMFKNPTPNFEITDSSDNMLLDSLDYKNITFNYVKPSANRHVRAGFFPFINTTTYDLSKYGIYNDINDVRIIEPCIITAFKASNAFTDNEINEIDAMIKVKSFPQAELKNISKLFKINIYVRHYKDNNKSSHIEFKDKTYVRSIKLMIFYDHYMLLEQINDSKQSNYALIKQMIANNKLRSMTNNELDTVFTKCITTTRTQKPYSNYRLIHVADNNKEYPLTCFNQYYFGYTPDDNEIEMRLNELQAFVNTLPLRNSVNVRCYKRFSMLMQKIMYEYGCFDNVYELSGVKRDEIRNQLTFPSRVFGNINDKQINEKCYYIDFNGAFCSFMTNIPSGLNDNVSNNKIKELINIMYNKRLEAKQNHNDKLAKTLKFIMCSCYGSSITRPKLYTNKRSQNIQGTIREHGDLVASYNDNGFVTIKKALVEHYNHPQFAKVILDGFKAKCNEIKSLVNVLFQNFDAFIVNEADYNKLNELGYIHPTELGKLKVEHVFKSITFKNKCSWIGINMDDSEFRHCC